MRPIQIYGQFADYWSNSMVSIGLVNGLAINGVRVRAWDRTGGYVADLHPLVETGMAPSDDCIGCFIGYPHFSVEALRGHETKVGFFITESAVLPTTWGLAARQCDLVVVPSYWVRGAYLQAGVDPAKLLVIPHGLHPVYETVQPRPATERGDGSRARPLRFLHTAGARDFIERKGTLQLLEAFGEVRKAFADEMQLTIRTPPSPQIDEAIHRLPPEIQRAVDMNYHDEPLSPASMRTYLLREGEPDGWTAVIQPSRAEAFGICPVEARVCGVPAILTNGHGHKMHVDTVAGDTLVACENNASIRVNGIPNGVAPTFETRELVAAWTDFLRCREERTACAIDYSVGYYQEWQWSKLIVPFVKWIKKQERGRGRRPEEKGW